jgi:hypothetical protein
MSPDKTYVVQIVVTIDVTAPDAQEARDATLSELARRCESGHGLIVHIEVRR